MEKGTEIDVLPEPLNAQEFMFAIIALTPATPALLSGPVSVPVVLDIDANGQVTRIVARHRDEKLSAAAAEAAAVLRFRPALWKDQPVATTGYSILVGFRPEAFG